MRHLTLALFFAVIALVGCVRGPYPPRVQQDFLTRCQGTLWPSATPPSSASALEAYCRCLLARQEHRWSHAQFDKVWVRIDQGAYLGSQFLGLSGSRETRYPNSIIAWMVECHHEAEFKAMRSSRR